MRGMIKTSQELRMLSSVTLNCQVTKIVMDSGSQLKELQSVSEMSQVRRNVFVIMVRSWSGHGLVMVRSWSGHGQVMVRS